MSISVVEQPQVTPTGITYPAREGEFSWTGDSVRQRRSVQRVLIHISATPIRESIATLPHPMLRLRHPIPVTIEREGGAVGVWSEDLEELGVGPDLSAAIEDFQRSVVELYRLLEATPPAQLGPDLARLQRRLQELIVVRS